MHYWDNLVILKNNYFYVKTVNTSIPIRSLPTNSKRVTAWISQTYRKVNIPSSASLVTRNLQVAEPTVTTRWSSASPNSHQVFLPSTTCRRKWERKTERLLSTTRSSPLSTLPRHLSTSRAKRTHPANWVWWNVPRPTASWCFLTKKPSRDSRQKTST